MMILCKLFGVLCITGSASVVDGDTIKVSGQSIRLWGIDAPELSEPFGEASKRSLKNLINERSVTCTQVSNARSYNRIVATCKIGNMDLGAAQVSSGAALDCAHYSNGHYRSFEPKAIRNSLIQKPYC